LLATAADLRSTAGAKGTHRRILLRWFGFGGLNAGLVIGAIDG
jgi:hypothetical protein